MTPRQELKQAGLPFPCGRTAPAVEGKAKISRFPGEVLGLVVSLGKTKIAVQRNSLGIAGYTLKLDQYDQRARVEVAIFKKPNDLTRIVDVQVGFADAFGDAD